MYLNPQHWLLGALHTGTYLSWRVSRVRMVPRAPPHSWGGAGRGRDAAYLSESASIPGKGHTVTISALQWVGEEICRTSLDFLR